MIQFSFEHREASPLCSVDPVTLTLAGIAAAGGFAASKAMSSGGAQPAAPAAPSAPPAAPQAAAPAPRKPMASGAGRGTQPSFIGAAAVPEQRSFGQKTLVGQ